MNGMKQLPAQSRPYERFLAVGAANLTDRELLAILLRSGTKGKSVLEVADEILQMKAGYSGILGLLHVTPNELKNISGLGEVKTAQLLCMVELSRRIAKACALERLDFTSPQSIARYFMEDMRHKERETTRIVILNTKCQMTDWLDIAEGTVMASYLDAREILREALRRDAVFICVLHNHPSGDPAPSMEDIRSTRRLLAAAEVVGIQVIDHIVIGDNKYKSFRELGIISG